MKKTLLLAASVVVAGATGAYAQGTIDWADNPSSTGHTLAVAIYSPQTSTPLVETTGNSQTDTPAGTTVYTGTALGGGATGSGPTGWGNGNNYTAELYALGSTTLLTTPAAFSALSPVSQYESTFYTVPAGAGWFKTVAPSPDPGIAGTGLTSTASATLAVAAWYNGGGTITTLGAAQSAVVPYGWSAPWVESSLGNALGASGTPNTAPVLSGLTSFSLVYSTVPEPATIVLCLLGAAGFLFRRRK